ncbi:MAG: capM2 [Candidatus Midichloriaceae bacterium]|jgi:glycosyltransferase involved in cell wall biosynthesis|nr:capM2 [Candidatus Midichloriaceae bacterium]
MKIFNVMFSKKLGGLEQAFLDYTLALQMQGNDVLSVVHPKSAVKNLIKGKYAEIHNFNRFDPFAVHAISKLIKKEKPDCIITHGARASYLFRRAKPNIPLIAVSHNNTRFEYLFGSDAIIAITEAMRHDIISAGQAEGAVFNIPNMLHLENELAYKAPKNNTPPVIGIVSRLFPIKGADIFINAMAELRDKGIDFKAKIAGDGPERQNCEKLIAELNLQKHVEILGWVEDKNAFYESLDIFCLPSRNESFGIVILEALAHSLPMVLTKTPGPIEIIGDTDAAILVNPSDHHALADGIINILSSQGLKQTLSQKAFERTKYYCSNNVSQQIQEALKKICALDI